MHYPDSQPHHDVPKPSAFNRYKGGILLLVIFAVSLLIAFYFLKGSQYEQTGKTGQVPPSPVISATATTSTFTSPVSPLAPFSPVPTNPLPTLPSDPALIEMAARRGQQLYERGSYEEALKLFNTVVEADPGNPKVYDARGSVYTALNDYTHALDDYNKAVELDPSFAQAYYNRGRVYSLLREYDQALADLQKSVNLDAPHFGYRADGNIGLIYHRQGKYDKALEAYTASITYNSANGDVFFLRGETYTALENYPAAIADYEAAVARFPRYDLAYQSLGYAYYRTGKNDKASEALKQAIEIAPDSPGAHFYLALVDVTTGDFGSATAAMSQAVDASSKLPPEDRKFLYTRVTADLKIFAKENPDRATAVESMLKLMPQSP